MAWCQFHFHSIDIIFIHFKDRFLSQAAEKVHGCVHLKIEIYLYFQHLFFVFVSLFHLRFIQFVSFKFKVYMADGSQSWRSVSGNTAHTLTAESCDMGMVFTFNCFRFNKYKFNKYSF